jgi:predicted TIM-barrel fold metal-dependent hydrolase
MGRKYAVISADSHLELVPEWWTPRVRAEHREYVPRLKRFENGREGIAVGDKSPRLSGLSLTGKPYQEYSPIAHNFTTSPGTGTPEQRLQEQDRDGVDGEVLFSGNHNLAAWREIRDPVAFREVIHAYNSYLAEEYCAVDRDRLIAMGIIPDTGLEDAMAELEYCARAGLKGVALDAFPTGRAYPSPEDDRFWAAALDLNIPLTIHEFMRFGKAKGDPNFIYKRKAEGIHGPASDFIGLLTKYSALFSGVGVDVTQMVVSGLFERFPKLKIFWAETQASWVPHFMETLDDRYERNRYWAERLLGLEQLPRKPSEYIREHCYWGFLRNPLGVRIRHEVGVDRMMWSNDFPHAVGDWPNSRKILEENFKGVPEDETYRMVAGNAIKFFHLDPSVDLNG